MASVIGKTDLAVLNFTSAIKEALREGNTFLVALSNERAALHHEALGDKEIAISYKMQACSYYEKWGGNAKFVQLKAQIEKYSNAEQECEPSQVGKG